jgi:hypothetical protein
LILISPAPTKGFHPGCGDLDVAERWVVYPGEEIYPLNSGTQAIPLAEFVRKLERQPG